MRLHNISDFLIGSAYVTIPAILIYFARRRTGLPFRHVFLLFGAFIIACGMTHYLDAYTFYHPTYRLSGLIKLITAIVSWATVLALVPLTPRALAMRSPQDLEREIEERKRIEKDLLDLNETLEQRVAERTAALEDRAQQLDELNQRLTHEVHEREMAQAELLRTNERLELAQTAGNIGAFDWNIKSGELTLTPQYAAHFGLSLQRTTVQSSELAQYIPEPARQALQNAVAEAVASGGELETEFPVLRPDGEERWLATRAHVISDASGEPERIVGVNLDITDRKNGEDDVRRRVEERTAELVAANRELEGFTYSVSHDLRAPLRGIVAASRMLVEDLGEDLSPASREHLASMSRSALHLSQLVDDLLQYSRLGRKDVAFQKIDMTELVESVAQLVQTSTAWGPLQVEVEQRMSAEGDPELLRLALFNLLENASKYRKVGEVAHVEVSCRAGDGEDTFIVKDRGIGFEMAYVHKLFEPFERLHRLTEYPGTGIGLANARRVIERHGGRIWAEGDLGEGAAFMFTLPHRGKTSRREKNT